MHITAQGPRLRNDLYCVECDVKLYYTIPGTLSNLQKQSTLLSFTPIFLLHLLYCEDCISSSFPWHKSKLYALLLVDSMFQILKLTGLRSGMFSGEKSGSSYSYLILLYERFKLQQYTYTLNMSRSCPD